MCQCVTCSASFCACYVIHDSINHLTKFELVNLYINVNETKDGQPLLSLYFEFRRFLLSVIFQSYLPAILMVLLAGFSMWIDAKSVPARVTLCVTTVLTIITIIASLKTTMPKVSYLTALDMYLWICFIFVLSTVIEYTVLNTVMNKKMRKLQESVKQKCCSNSVKERVKKKLNNNTFQEYEKSATAEMSYSVSPSLRKKLHRAVETNKIRHLVQQLKAADPKSTETTIESSRTSSPINEVKIYRKSRKSRRFSTISEKSNFKGLTPYDSNNHSITCSRIISPHMSMVNFGSTTLPMSLVQPEPNEYQKSMNFVPMNFNNNNNRGVINRNASCHETILNETGNNSPNFAIQYVDQYECSQLPSEKESTCRKPRRKSSILRVYKFSFLYKMLDTWENIFTMDVHHPGIDPQSAIKLDVYFRRFYMCLFAIFNATYWTMLLKLSQIQSLEIERIFNEDEKMMIDREIKPSATENFP